MGALSKNNFLFHAVREIPTIEIIKAFNPTLDLIRRGARYVSECPFHPDTQPSLIVFPDGGWRCFGCGEYGDAVGFVAKLEGLRPLEAAQAIAQQFGIITDVRQITGERKQQFLEAQRERDLQAAFMDWQRDTFQRLVGFRDTVMSTFRVNGLATDDATLQIVREYMPQIEHYIEILAIGSEREKLALFKWGVI